MMLFWASSHRMSVVVGCPFIDGQRGDGRQFPWCCYHGRVQLLYHIVIGLGYGKLVTGIFNVTVNSSRGHLLEFSSFCFLVGSDGKISCRSWVAYCPSDLWLVPHSQGFCADSGLSTLIVCLANLWVLVTWSVNVWRLSDVTLRGLESIHSLDGYGFQSGLQQFRS